MIVTYQRPEDEKPQEALVTEYQGETHRAYVMATWERGTQRPRGALEDMIRRKEARCLVAAAPDGPDNIAGWAAVEPAGAIVWVHVRKTEWGGGLATALLRALGVNGERPIACRYWSPKASVIARSSKYRLYYEPREEKAA